MTLKKSDVFSTKEAAKVLGVNENTLRSMLTDGRLSAHMDTSGAQYITRDVLLGALGVKGPRPTDAKKLQRVLDLCSQLEARILLLEDVILNRAEEKPQHDKEDLTQIRSLALAVLEDREIGTADKLPTVLAWAADLNQICYEDAKIIGVRLLYALVEHFLSVYDIFLSSSSDLEVIRGRENLVTAKHRMVAFAALSGITISPDLTSLVMTRLNSKPRED